MKWRNSIFKSHALDGYACIVFVYMSLFIDVLSTFCCLCNNNNGFASVTNGDRRLFTWIGVVVFSFFSFFAISVVYCFSDREFPSFTFHFTKWQAADKEIERATSYEYYNGLNQCTYRRTAKWLLMNQQYLDSKKKNRCEQDCKDIDRRKPIEEETQKAKATTAHW